MESKASTKIYRFGGYPFKQSVLTYLEFEEAVRLSSQFLDSLPSIGSFGAALDMIIKSGMVPKLVQIVIKPHAKTILHRLYYQFKRRIRRVDITDPISLMDLEDVAEVLRDFFSINTNSLMNLNIIENKSALFNLLKHPETSSDLKK